MRRFVFSFAALTAVILAPTAMKAQSAEPFNYYNNISPSISSFAMERYGNVEHSLYTGAMTYSLPLYTYQDEDFTLPISLEYHYDGFRPAQNSGSVGYGWALNCGGTITREVRGFPDEYNEMDEGIYGYFYYVLPDGRTEDLDVINAKYQRPSFSFTIESNVIVSILNDTPVYADTTLLAADYQHRYDSCPDIFHFSLPGGTSGSFIMDRSGVFRVFNTSGPHGEISVSTDFSVNRFYGPQVYFSFTITTGDGYEYTFGGIRSAMEYNAVLGNEDLSVTMSAWRLRSIKAPNGRTMTFVYDESHLIQESVTATINPRVDGCGVAVGPTTISGHQQANMRYSISLTYESRLSRIETGTHSIMFGYSERDADEPFSSERATDRYAARGAAYGAGISNDEDPMRLTSISVYNGQDTVETVTLSHTYKSNLSGNKMFLSSVNSTRTGNTVLSTAIHGVRYP